MRRENDSPIQIDGEVFDGGTLIEVEAVVKRVEQAGSLEAACSTLRLDILLPGALRWVRRRVQAIHGSLGVLMGLMPERFSGCEPRLSSFAGRLSVVNVLPVLRQIAAPFLLQLLAPLGFRPRSMRVGKPDYLFQHPMGPDPPPTSPLSPDHYPSTVIRGENADERL